MFIPETNDPVKARGGRGGFAVGGFDADKKQILLYILMYQGETKLMSIQT